jgi:hypothetical protein
MAIRLLVPIALAANGLAAGVLLWSAIGGVPLLLSLPADRYVRVHQFWATRFEPFQPICILTTALADSVLSFVVPAGPARLLMATAALAAFATAGVSTLRSVPLKRLVMSVDPDALPADWPDRDPRRSWANANLIRTALTVMAFAANVSAVSLLL